jgi:hypothetical protein
MPKTTTDKTRFNNIMMLLKQIELAYNLSPKLKKSQIKSLQKEFDKIMVNYENTKNPTFRVRIHSSR